MILVSISSFLGVKNTLRSQKMMLAYYATQHKNSLWRQKWLPAPPNDGKSVTIGSNLMILMSIPGFLGQGTH